ncbi:50S ribosomal protein L35 [Candidatus Peregrinibacteria bacterium HGW-Peregrinibacteria-1]|jgi:large subunit ribosomal protein L35|nr:MAG: 50S ribosomal protein L35 [Candidatus Peregrinibacteria bacterium HGW-Peregrinibacteria-1]
MKQKTHSGAKKRIKIRNSGSAVTKKAATSHLLVNKSKGQKSMAKTGIPVHKTRVKALRRMMPGKLGLQNKVVVAKSEVESK